MAAGALVGAVVFTGVELDGFRVIGGGWRLGGGAFNAAIYGSIAAMLVGSICMRIARRRAINRSASLRSD